MKLRKNEDVASTAAAAMSGLNTRSLLETVWLFTKVAQRWPPPLCREPRAWTSGPFAC
jgi:hypothetical protein